MSLIRVWDRRISDQSLQYISNDKKAKCITDDKTQSFSRVFSTLSSSSCTLMVFIDSMPQTFTEFSFGVALSHSQPYNKYKFGELPHSWGIYNQKDILGSSLIVSSQSIISKIRYITQGDILQLDIDCEQLKAFLSINNNLIQVFEIHSSNYNDYVIGCTLCKGVTVTVVTDDKDIKKATPNENFKIKLQRPKSAGTLRSTQKTLSTSTSDRTVIYGHHEEPISYIAQQILQTNVLLNTADNSSSHNYNSNNNRTADSRYTMYQKTKPDRPQSASSKNSYVDTSNSTSRKSGMKSKLDFVISSAAAASGRRHMIQQQQQQQRLLRPSSASSFGREGRNSNNVNANANVYPSPYLPSEDMRGGGGGGGISSSNRSKSGNRSQDHPLNNNHNKYNNNNHHHHHHTTGTLKTTSNQLTHDANGGTSTDRNKDKDSDSDRSFVFGASKVVAVASAEGGIGGKEEDVDVDVDEEGSAGRGGLGCHRRRRRWQRGDGKKGGQLSSSSSTTPAPVPIIVTATSLSASYNGNGNGNDRHQLSRQKLRDPEDSEEGPGPGPVHPMRRCRGGKRPRQRWTYDPLSGRRMRVLSSEPSPVPVEGEGKEIEIEGGGGGEREGQSSSSPSSQPLPHPIKIISYSSSLPLPSPWPWYGTGSGTAVRPSNGGGVTSVVDAKDNDDDDIRLPAPIQWSLYEHMASLDLLLTVEHSEDNRNHNSNSNSNSPSHKYGTRDHHQRPSTSPTGKDKESKLASGQVEGEGDGDGDGERNYEWEAESLLLELAYWLHSPNGYRPLARLGVSRLLSNETVAATVTPKTASGAGTGTGTGTGASVPSSSRLQVVRMAAMNRRRHGAFEVQVAYKHPTRGLISETLHSKLNTSNWPSKTVLKRRLVEFLERSQVQSWSLRPKGRFVWHCALDKTTSGSVTVSGCPFGCRVSGDYNSRYCFPISASMSVSSTSLHNNRCSISSSSDPSHVNVSPFTEGNRRSLATSISTSTSSAVPVSVPATDATTATGFTEIDIANMRRLGKLPFPEFVRLEYRGRSNCSGSGVSLLEVVRAFRQPPAPRPRPRSLSRDVYTYRKGRSETASAAVGASGAMSPFPSPQLFPLTAGQIKFCFDATDQYTNCKFNLQDTVQLTASNCRNIPYALSTLQSSTSSSTSSTLICTVTSAHVNGSYDVSCSYETDLNILHWEEVGVREEVLTKIATDTDTASSSFSFIPIVQGLEMLRLSLTARESGGAGGGGGGGGSDNDDDEDVLMAAANNNNNNNNNKNASWRSTLSDSGRVSTGVVVYSAPISDELQHQHQETTQTTFAADTATATSTSNHPHLVTSSYKTSVPDPVPTNSVVTKPIVKGSSSLSLPSTTSSRPRVNNPRKPAAVVAVAESSTRIQRKIPSSAHVQKQNIIGSNNINNQNSSSSISKQKKQSVGSKVNSNNNNNTMIHNVISNQNNNAGFVIIQEEEEEEEEEVGKSINNGDKNEKPTGTSTAATSIGDGYGVSGDGNHLIKEEDTGTVPNIDIQKELHTDTVDRKDATTVAYYGEDTHCHREASGDYQDDFAPVVDIVVEDAVHTSDIDGDDVTAETDDNDQNTLSVLDQGAGTQTETQTQTQMERVCESNEITVTDNVDEYDCEYLEEFCDPVVVVALGGSGSGSGTDGGDGNHQATSTTVKTSGTATVMGGVTCETSMTTSHEHETETDEISTTGLSTYCNSHDGDGGGGIRRSNSNSNSNLPPVVQHHGILASPYKDKRRVIKNGAHVDFQIPPTTTTETETETTIMVAGEEVVEEEMMNKQMITKKNRKNKMMKTRGRNSNNDNIDNDIDNENDGSNNSKFLQTDYNQHLQENDGNRHSSNDDNTNANSTDTSPVINVNDNTNANSTDTSPVINVNDNNSSSNDNNSSSNDKDVKGGDGDGSHLGVGGVIIGAAMSSAVSSPSAVTITTATNSPTATTTSPTATTTSTKKTRRRGDVDVFTPNRSPYTSFSTATAATATDHNNSNNNSNSTVVRGIQEALSAAASMSMSMSPLIQDTTDQQQQQQSQQEELSASKGGKIGEQGVEDGHGQVQVQVQVQDGISQTIVSTDADSGSGGVTDKDKDKDKGKGVVDSTDDNKNNNNRTGTNRLNIQSKSMSLDTYIEEVVSDEIKHNVKDIVAIEVEVVPAIAVKARRRDDFEEDNVTATATATGEVDDDNYTKKETKGHDDDDGGDDHGAAAAVPFEKRPRPGSLQELMAIFGEEKENIMTSASAAKTTREHNIWNVSDDRSEVTEHGMPSHDEYDGDNDWMDD
eukprot:gene5004-10011_t